MWRREKLTAIRVKNLKEPGMYLDGDGLYLRVNKTQAKSWIYRYMFRGKSYDLGLGSARFVSLKHARILATEFKLLQIQGIDPLSRKNEQRQQLIMEEHFD